MVTGTGAGTGTGVGAGTEAGVGIGDGTGAGTGADAGDGIDSPVAEMFLTSPAMHVWIKPTAESSAFLHAEKAAMHLFLAFLTAVAVSLAAQLFFLARVMPITAFDQHSQANVPLVRKAFSVRQVSDVIFEML